jgi:hypothetical protein
MQNLQKPDNRRKAKQVLATDDVTFERPHREFNDQLIGLIGSRDAVIQRAAELLEEGHAQLVLQVLDILLKHDPEDINARKLHLKILEVLSKADYRLMSLNTWVYFMDKDRGFLRSKRGRLKKLHIHFAIFFVQH